MFEAFLSRKSNPYTRSWSKFHARETPRVPVAYTLSRVQGPQTHLGWARERSQARFNDVLEGIDFDPHGHAHPDQSRTGRMSPV